jgi:fumarate reductase subunit C
MSRRPYKRKMKRSWWLRRRRYFAYMLRELTSLFVGLYSALLVIGLVCLVLGSAVWERFLAALSSPAGITFQLVCLAFATYHSVTWFALTPKAMPMMLRGQPVSAKAIVSVHYAAWIALSVVVLIIVARI